MDSRKPVIGVITNKNDPVTGAPIPHPGVTEAVTRLGGEVRPINHYTLRLYELIGEVVQLDGMILPGGGDIDPSYYGAERIPQCGESSRARDEIETNLFPLLMTRALPILGICRGHQVMNVCFGGTLIQDLPSQKGLYHRQAPDDPPYSHSVRIVPGTRLAKILGTDKLLVNSYHHQAVEELAQGFKVSALAEDGTIEAIESAAPGQFLLSVQWHPEVILDDPASMAIFSAFMDAVRLRMSTGCSHEE